MSNQDTKQEETKKQEQRPIIQVIEAPKDTSNRKLIIAIVIALCLAVTGYALTVDNFKDYNAPDYLYINWADYMYKDNSGNYYDSPAKNNAPSEYPRQTVEYPYRALFYGRTSSGYTYMFCVYSKQSATDLFTFEYMGDDKGTKSGRLRAFIDTGKINKIDQNNPNNNSDILIYGAFDNGLDASNTVHIGTIGYPNTTVSTPSCGTQGIKTYFNFDFFYDCSSEHQQGANDLSISGLTSISGPNYNYIIHCKDHTGYTGGGGNSGGSSSGSNGGQKWGNGQHGGGIDWGSSGAPSINSGGSYDTSRPDWNYNKPSLDDLNNYEYSTPDDWRDYASSGKGNSDKTYSWENDANIPDYNFNIPIPPFTGQGDGDTGYTGGTIPDFGSIPMDDIEYNFTIPSMPNKDKIQIIGTPDDLYFINLWPPKYPQ